MIYGFENETSPLNNIELQAASIIRDCLVSFHVGAKNAVTAEQIARGMASMELFRDKNSNPYLTGARIRKIVNHLRTTGKCPNLIATSKGYYICNDPAERREYIDGLKARAMAILNVVAAMEGASV